jgi:hypothetical protein
LSVSSTEERNVYHATAMESLVLTFDPNPYVYNIHCNYQNVILIDDISPCFVNYVSRQRQSKQAILLPKNVSFIKK